MVAQGVPCLGPVTQAGCGAICPLYARGCFGCFGPKEQPNTEALAAHWSELGADRQKLLHAFRGITGNAPAFRREATFHECISSQCATACAKAGSPLVILSDNGTIYWAIADTTPSSGQNEKLLPFAGQNCQRQGLSAWRFERLGH